MNLRITQTAVFKICLISSIRKPKERFTSLLNKQPELFQRLPQVNIFMFKKLKQNHRIFR